MTWQDGEQIIQQHKDNSRNSANTYLIVHPMEQHPMRKPTVRVRMLASIGGALIVIGYRLQSGYEQMTTTALEPTEGLRFSSNGSGPSGC